MGTRGRRWWGLALCASAVACGSGTVEEVDAGLDAAIRRDAAPAEAGTADASDAGRPEDGGVSADGGALPGDGGLGADGAMAADGGDGRDASGDGGREGDGAIARDGGDPDGAVAGDGAVQADGGGGGDGALPGDGGAIDDAASDGGSIAADARPGDGASPADAGPSDAAGFDGGVCEADPDCDDGRFCTGVERCGPGGTCLPGAPQGCPPTGDPCRPAVCDPIADACEVQPLGDGAPCDDGVFCTVGETCLAGVCQDASPRTCADLDACTDDRCDEPTRTCANVFDPACTVCSDDVFEDADTRATAAPTGSGRYPGLYACVGDDDWHAFTLRANELVEVRLEFQDAIGDLNAHLFDAAGRQVAASVSADDDEQIVYTASVAGTYDLRISFNSGGGDDDDIPGNRYVMTATVGAPCTDRFEDDDLRAAATPLGSGVEPGLRVCPYDDDWFALSVGDNELIVAEARFEDAEGDLDLRLYDAAGGLVAAALSATDDERLAYTAPAGTYYLRVNLNRDRDDRVPGADYDLTLDLGAACVDPFEDDDERTTAAPVLSGAQAARACPGEDDWFAFVAAANDVLQLSLDFVNASGNLDLRLVDPTGTLLAVSLGSRDGEAIAWTAPVDGTYFAQVSLVGDDRVPGTDYTLTLDTSQRCVDPYEDDDSRPFAAPLGAGVFPGISACPGDADWFRLPVTAPGPVQIDLAFTDATGNLDARLFDGVGTLLASSLSNTDDEHLAYVAPRAGDLFLEVRLVADDATPGNAYALTVSGADPCAPRDCGDVSAECGLVFDGCGRYEDCGTCTVGDCSANHRCDCTPGSCTSLGLDCGRPDDGCGTPLDCGPCQAPELCGGAHVPFVCASPSCPADRLEDNDTRATAQAVTVGTHAGLIACPGDDDHYAIALGANEVLVAEADFLDAEGNLDLRLLDPAGALVAASLGQGDRERLAYTAPAAGTYTIRATFAGGDDAIPGVDYVLRLATALCTDAFEDADARASAAPLPPGIHGGLVACPSDEDWYRVTVADDDLIDVTARFVDAEGNVDLRLTDAAGNLLASSLSRADRERIVLTAPAAGDYYLRVTLAGDDLVPGAAYALELAASTPCVDRFEGNDARLSAAPLAPGLHAGLAACPGDLDWYRVVAAGNAVIVASAAFTHAAGNVDLRLYDARGNLVDSALGQGDGERIVYTTPSAGTFYLRVDLAGGDADPPGNAYVLELSTDLACVDVFEDDDSRPGAAAIGSGSFPGLAACPDDEDWFAVDAHAGDTLDVALDFSHASGNIDVRLYDPSGGLVAASLSNNDDEAIAYAVPTDGTYAIRVGLASDDAAPGNTYAMTITGAEPCPARPLAVACAGAECGPRHDGCGAMLDCGDCPGGGACSPNNRCDCVASDCGSLGASCGAPDDGCGAPLFCGECVEPALCGGAYVDFMCASPSCPADALEDNDSRPAAPELADGTYDDLTLCPGDDDWYELDVGNNVVLAIDAEFDNTKGNLELRLYNASSTLLDSSLSNTDDEHVRFTTPAAGTYFVRAQLAGTDDEIPGNRYRLHIDTSAQCLDALEDDDRSIDATPLVAGTQPNLTACPDDPDWFEVTVAEDELMVFELDFTDALGNVDARLYDAAGGLIASALSASDDERIVLTAPQAGVYRLRVDFVEASGDDATAGNTYDLVTRLGTLCADPLEGNDSRADAVPLPPGPQGLRACPGDQDWFTIDVAAGRRLGLHAAFVDAAGNVDLRLYDAGGNLVASALSSSDDERIDYVTTAAGPYYARVDLVDDDAVPGNDYTLTVTDVAP